MDQRSAVDAVVFIGIGTFLVTYALLLITWQHHDQRIRWSGGRDPLATQTPAAVPLTLVGTLAAIWGGTGLQHHTSTWVAGLAAVGPILALRVVIVVRHNRRVTASRGASR